MPVGWQEKKKKTGRYDVLEPSNARASWRRVATSDAAARSTGGLRTDHWTEHMEGMKTLRKKTQSQWRCGGKGLIGGDPKRRGGRKSETLI